MYRRQSSAYYYLLSRPTQELSVVGSYCDCVYCLLFPANFLGLAEKSAEKSFPAKTPPTFHFIIRNPSSIDENKTKQQ